MQLYIYTLKNCHQKDAKLTKEVCEVEEKPKAYWFKNRFPSEYSGRYITKTDIGHAIEHGSVVALEKDDLALAKSAFNAHWRKEIHLLQSRINAAQEKLNIVEKTEGI